MTLRISLKASLAGALALGLAVGAAFAQPAADNGKGAALRAACSADFQKYCPNMQMGPDMKACVRTNFKSLSDGCKAALKQLRSSRQEQPQGGGNAAPQ